MIEGWQEVPLGELLTRIKNEVLIQDFEKYQRLTIHGRNKGISIRDEFEGHQIDTKKQFVVHKGQFLLSKIDAMNGAFGIIPEYVEKGIITSNFWAYDVDEERLFSKYFNFLTHTRTFHQFCVQSSSGTTHRKYLQEDLFLGKEISLPPLDEQHRIVKRIEDLIVHIKKAQSLREETQENLEFLESSIRNAVFEGKLTIGKDIGEDANELVKRNLRERRAKWESSILAKGKAPDKAKYEEPILPNTNDFPSLPSHWVWVTWEMLLAHEEGAFRRGPFGSTLRKSIFVDSGYKVYEQYCPINDDCSFGRYYITPEMFKKLKSFEVKAGDFLISCSGVTLGRITQVPSGSDEGVINQALLRVRINNKIIDDKYFLYCFRAPFFQKLLFANSKGSAIPNVKGVKELKAIPIALPPLDEQRRIVAYLDSVQARLASLRELQSATGEELSALLPSVLDKAFKGEL